MIQDFVVEKSEAYGCFINNGIQMLRCKLYTYAWVLEQAYVIWRIVSLDGEHIICYDVLYQLKNNWIQNYRSHICYKILLIVQLNHILTHNIVQLHICTLPNKPLSLFPLRQTNSDQPTFDIAETAEAKR